MGKKLSLEFFSEIAESHGGKCISTEYIKVTKALQFECIEGHRFSLTGSSAKNGSWCYECKGITQWTLEKVLQLIESKGGKSLLSKYTSPKDEVTITCEHNHTWTTKCAQIQSGRWCHYCSGTIVDKDEMLKRIQDIAISKGGRCLSDKYESSLAEILMECSCGYQWKTTGNSIQKGTWCAKCAKCAPLDLKEFQDYALERGGECLSKEYISTRKPLNFRCREGHEWSVTPNSMKKNKTWCKVCSSISQRTSIEVYKQIARDKEGVCLSVSNDAVDGLIEFQCSKGHIFKSDGDRIKKGAWCYKCYSDTRITIEDIKKIAIDKGGVCLSNEIISISEKLNFRCSEGHEWSTLVGGIKHGSWCPSCARGIITIQEVKDFVELKGGKCLTDVYEGSSCKLDLQCSNGHTWRANYHSIKNMGSWCPHCVGLAKIDIKTLQQIAIDRGGRLISEEYVNSYTPLIWECSEKHRWSAAARNVKNGGTWCPYCSTSKSENQFRDVIEEMSGEEFPMCWPEWLINPRTGYGMELDGYCEKLSMAFEYQGLQHYQIVEYFNMDEESLAQQRFRDEEKKRQCEARGIFLIVVPYIVSSDMFASWIRVLVKERMNGKKDEW